MKHRIRLAAGAACPLVLLLQIASGCGSAPAAPEPGPEVVGEATDTPEPDTSPTEDGDAASADRAMPDVEVEEAAEAEAGEVQAGDPVAGSEDSGADPESIVLAVVNGAPMTFADALETFEVQHTGHGTLIQGEEAVRELVGRLVVKRLLLAEAEALGLADSEEIRLAVELRRDALAERLFWRRAVDERVAVTDEEVEDYYAKTDVALRLTLIETAERPAAEALRARVVAGEDMAELARKHSTHASASFDGLLPFVRRGELDPTLEESAFALEEPGDLTPVAPTASGFAFVRLDERTENTNRPTREVGLPQIRNVLEDRARKARRAEVEARLEDEAEIVIEEELLTRETLLATTTPDAVAARSAGETLLLEELRELLDLDAVRAADEREVADAVEGIVRGWALKRAVRQAEEFGRHLQDPEIVEQVAAYEQEGLLAVLFGRYVFADIDPTEAEVRTYYEEHQETKFTRPVELRVAYIAVATDAEARDALRRIEAGESLGDLAREVSLDVRSRVHGGRIGWVRPGEMLPEVEEVLFGMEVDAIEGPIATDRGHFVVQVLERKEARVMPFEVAVASARKGLVAAQQQEARAAWTEKLRERADVQISDVGIARAVAWIDANAPEQPEPGPLGPHQQGPPLPADLLEDAEVESTITTEEGGAR